MKRTAYPHLQRWVAVALAFSPACQGQSAMPLDNTVALEGAALVTIGHVPDDVRCVRILVDSWRPAVRAFTTNPGGSALLRLDGLATGDSQFRGEAYVFGCADLVPDGVPSWVSEPVRSPVEKGAPVEVTLLMRRNGRATVKVDFEDEPGAGNRPDAGADGANSDAASKDGGTTETAQADAILTPTCGDGIQSPGEMCCSADFAGTVTRQLVDGIDHAVQPGLHVCLPPWSFEKDLPFPWGMARADFCRRVTCDGTPGCMATLTARTFSFDPVTNAFRGSAEVHIDASLDAKVGVSSAACALQVTASHITFSGVIRARGEDDRLVVGVDSLIVDTGTPGFSGCKDPLLSPVLGLLTSNFSLATVNNEILRWVSSAISSKSGAFQCSVSGG